MSQTRIIKIQEHLISDRNTYQICYHVKFAWTNFLLDEKCCCTALETGAVVVGEPYSQPYSHLQHQPAEQSVVCHPIILPGLCLSRTQYNSRSQYEPVDAGQRGFLFFKMRILLSWSIKQYPESQCIKIKSFSFQKTNIG